jgi:hypothetical protein
MFNNIEKLDRDILDLKFNDNRSLKNKNYRNLILAMNNSDIISIVLSNVIPHCVKYNNIHNQNIASLYEKIGIELTKNFYKNE